MRDIMREMHRERERELYLGVEGGAKDGEKVLQ